MTTTAVRCVLLDLGKVLLDFDFRRFSRFMEERTGLGVERLREALLGHGLAVDFELGRIREVEFHEEVCRRTGTHIPFGEFAVAWSSIFFDEPLVPEEWLEVISRRASPWVVSNTNPLHFGSIRSRYGFLRHMRGFILSYEVGAMKPDRRIFELALERAGCAAQEAVFVDDHAENVESARALGVDAFQFRSTEQFAAEMRVRDLL